MFGHFGSARTKLPGGGGDVNLATGRHAAWMLLDSYSLAVVAMIAAQQKQRVARLSCRFCRGNAMAIVVDGEDD